MMFEKIANILIGVFLPPIAFFAFVWSLFFVVALIVNLLIAYDNEITPWSPAHAAACLVDENSFMCTGVVKQIVIDAIPPPVEP